MVGHQFLYQFSKFDPVSLPTSSRSGQCRTRMGRGEHLRLMARAVRTWCPVGGGWCSPAVARTASRWRRCGWWRTTRDRAASRVEALQVPDAGGWRRTGATVHGSVEDPPHGQVDTQQGWVGRGAPPLHPGLRPSGDGHAAGAQGAVRRRVLAALRGRPQPHPPAMDARFHQHDEAGRGRPGRLPRRPRGRPGLRIRRTGRRLGRHRPALRQRGRDAHAVGAATSALPRGAGAAGARHALDVRVHRIRCGRAPRSGHPLHSLATSGLVTFASAPAAGATLTSSFFAASVTVSPAATMRSAQRTAKAAAPRGTVTSRCAVKPSVAAPRAGTAPTPSPSPRLTSSGVANGDLTRSRRPSRRGTANTYGCTVDARPAPWQWGVYRS